LPSHRVELSYLAMVNQREWSVVISAFALLCRGVTLDRGIIFMIKSCTYAHEILLIFAENIVIC
jgi:hypothetical protein